MEIAFLVMLVLEVGYIAWFLESRFTTTGIGQIFRKEEETIKQAPPLVHLSRRGPASETTFAPNERSVLANRRMTPSEISRELEEKNTARAREEARRKAANG